MDCNGKILFVDDRYDDTISAAVTNLLMKGLPVQYWNSKGDFPDTIRNVRIVILDLDLVGLGQRSGGDSDYYLAAEALSKIPGPFLVVIMATEYTDKDPENLRRVYEDFYQRPFPGFLSEQGLSRDDEISDVNLILKRIEAAIDKNRILKMILLLESTLEKAQDLAMKDLARMEIENSIVALVQSTFNDFGLESGARELIGIMMRLLTRSACQGKDFSEFDKVVRDLNKLPSPATTDRLMYHRLTFFQPGPGETVWTGDIYETSNERKYDQYAIVLTPACDLAQDKAQFALACFAFPLKEEFLNDLQYPPYVVDDECRELAKSSISKAAELVKEKYFDFRSKRKLAQRMYRIAHLVHNGGEPFGVCFDFTNVRSLPVDDVKKWKRVCRLDSPFIEDMLQKYGSHAFRIGVPDWK